MTEYQVTGDIAHVTVDSMLGLQRQTLYKGSRFQSPPATEQEVTHLLSINVIKKLGDEPDEPDEPDGADADAGDQVPASEREAGTSADAPQAETGTGHGQALSVTTGEHPADEEPGSEEPADQADEAQDTTDTEARRQTARDKLAKLGGKAPNARHGDEVLVEYLVQQGGNYEDLVRAERDDLLGMVKARQS
ncbi:hypothetical protein [Micromonospora craterilacus]|nr:hypothetical protein [Micromonospora craterilacus]